MHLHGDHLERYNARDLPQPMLVALDAHVSNCLYCSRSLAHAAAASGRWERRGWLGRLVRIQEPESEAVTLVEDQPAARAA
jgi:hypothetical protein